MALLLTDVETEGNENVEITHVHLNDNTVAGIHIKDKNCLTVQYHPDCKSWT